MTKNKQIVIAIFAILTLSVSLICCEFNATNVQNSAKSIIKNAILCNTFEKLPEKSPQNINVMPDADGEDDTRKTEPYEGESNSPEKQIESRTASKNVLTGEVLIEATTGRVLYGANETERLYPASTTKILTALCVLNNLPIDEVATVPKEAVGVEGSSLYLKAGQKITVEDLLYGLMLRSGNDCAVALAMKTSGSIQKFADLMNKTAFECGALDSNFVNPHGLQDENHYTTPLDLAKITAKAYKNRDFLRIVSSKMRKIEIDDEEIVIANKNKMLKLYAGANGVKTGFTKSSGRCLVSGARRGDMQLISVVLNCGDMWNESVRLLNLGFDNYFMCPLDNALLTGGNSEVRVVAKGGVDASWHSIKYPLRKDGTERLVVTYTALP